MLYLASLCLLAPALALAQGNTADDSSSAASDEKPPNVCESLDLNKPGEPLAATLTRVEEAIRTDNASLFAASLHPSIIKSGDEKDAIFKNMMDNYRLEAKKLLRNHVFKLEINQDIPIAMCREEFQVRAVSGPKDQWAIEFTTTNAGEQARIFMLFATVPQALQKKSKLEVGLVHLHTQNWSFNKMTPDSLFEEAKKWALLSEPVAAWALGTAAKRIVRSNPYFFDTRYESRLRDLVSWTKEFEKTTASYPGTKVPDTELKLHSLTTVYKADAVQVGAKLVTDKEIPVNAQIESCAAVARYLAPLFKGIRKSFTGIECLLYRQGEATEGAPEAGTVFSSFNDALRDNKPVKL